MAVKEHNHGFVNLNFQNVIPSVMLKSIFVQALKGIRHKVQLATKFGINYEDGQFVNTIRGDPAYVRAACEASLKRLDVDYIDLYYQHRVDNKVPIEVTVRVCSYKKQTCFGSVFVLSLVALW